MSKKGQAIHCNCCGTLICMEDAKTKTSYLHMEKEWGYFSKGKDGEIHHIDICEDCYDKWIQTLSIAPEIEKITEYI